MKSNALRLALLIGAIIGLVSISSASALASGSSSDLPAPVVSALDELKKTGKLSEQARSTLLRYPEIAAQVADPAGDEVELSIAPAAKDATSDALGCWITDAHVRKRTVLGFTAYKFHQQAHWCANGSAVTSVHVRFHHITENDGFNIFRGLTGDWVGGTPAWYVESFKQGHMENCVPRLGCISSSYPWVKIKMWGNNGVGADGGV